MGIWMSESGLVTSKQGVILESYVSHTGNGGSLQ